MNQQLFLSECGKSYPEVIAALAYFRQSIYQQCKPVVQKRIKEFAKALGVPHEKLKLSEYAWPDSYVPTDLTEMGLGWKARRSQDLCLFFYLCWDLNPESSVPLSVVISFWIKDSMKLEKLEGELDQHRNDAGFKDEPWKLYGGRQFWMALQESEIPQVGDKLDVLFGHTIRFLKSLEGIKDYFRA
jgi:hypothetical protein